MSTQIQDTSSGAGDLAAYDTSKYSQVDPDSNYQSTVTTGGEDRLITRSGGADDQQDTGQSGGREIA
jgi:hypothetical protein